MFDQEFLKYLVQLGVGGAIAGLMFAFYRKDVRAYTELWKAQSEILIAVVKENSANTATNTEVLKSLHRRIDRLDVLRVLPDEDVSP